MNAELFIAERYLKAKRKGLFAIITTIIGVAGVAIGVAALITTLSVMNGFQSDIQRKILGAQSHLAIYGRISRTEASELQKKLSSDPDFAASAPFVYGQAIITFRDRTSGVVVKGLDPGQESGINTLSQSVTSGTWLSLESRQKTPPIILGEELSRNLGAWIGDEVVLVSPQTNSALGIIPKMRKFKITAVIKTGYYEFDNTTAYCPLNTAADFFNIESSVSGIGIKLKNVSRTEKAAMRIKAALGYRFVVRTYAQMNQTLFAALKLEKFVMSVILVLIVLVAAFNIASNLILLGTEKLRDIGLLRAMGAKPSVISRIFWLEGALIGGTGILIGLALGIGLSWIIGHYPIVELPADVYYLSRVPVDIRITDIAATAAGSLVLCLLASVYPARRASTVHPVDAIRYG